MLLTKPLKKAEAALKSEKLQSQCRRLAYREERGGRFCGSRRGIVYMEWTDVAIMRTAYYIIASHKRFPSFFFSFTTGLQHSLPSSPPGARERTLATLTCIRYRFLSSRPSSSRGSKGRSLALPCCDCSICIALARRCLSLPCSVRDRMAQSRNADTR